jgi:hypothetical protein
VHKTCIGERGLAFMVNGAGVAVRDPIIVGDPNAACFLRTDDQASVLTRRWSTRSGWTLNE